MRPAILILLVISFQYACGQQLTPIEKSKGFWILQDEKGNSVRGIQCDNLESYKSGFVASSYDRSGKYYYYFFYNNKGEPLSSSSYSGYAPVIDMSVPDVFCLKYDNYYGYRRAEDKIVVHPYDLLDANDFSEGLATAKDQNFKYGALDQYGVIAIPFQYEYLGNYSNGRFIAKSAGKFGLLDKQNIKKIPFQYNEIKPAVVNKRQSNYGQYKDYYLLKKNEKWGMADANNKIIVPANFDEVTAGNYGYIRTKLAGKSGLYDTKGKERVRPSYDGISLFPNLFFARTSNKYYAKTYQNKPVNNAVYENIGLYNERYAIFVKQYGRWGIMDSMGKMLTQTVYDTILPFFGAKATLASQYKKWGVINRNGQPLTSFKYDSLYDEEDGLIQVFANNKTGFISATTFQEVIPVRFDYVAAFDNDVFVVSSNNLYGFMNKYGVELTPMKYSDVYDKSDGMICIEINGRFGYLDGNSYREAITPKYEWAGQFENGYAIVKYNGKASIISKSDRPIFPFQYDEVDFPSDGMIRFKNNGYYGYLDAYSYNVVISPRYELAYNFQNGEAMVQIDRQMWIIDKRGTQLRKTY